MTDYVKSIFHMGEVIDPRNIEVALVNGRLSVSMKGECDEEAEKALKEAVNAAIAHIGEVYRTRVPENISREALKREITASLPRYIRVLFTQGYEVFSEAVEAHAEKFAVVCRLEDLAYIDGRWQSSEGEILEDGEWVSENGIHSRDAISRLLDQIAV